MHVSSSNKEIAILTADRFYHQTSTYCSLLQINECFYLPESTSLFRSINCLLCLRTFVTDFSVHKITQHSYKYNIHHQSKRHIETFVNLMAHLRNKKESRHLQPFHFAIHPLLVIVKTTIPNNTTDPASIKCRPYNTLGDASCIVPPITKPPPKNRIFPRTPAPQRQTHTPRSAQQQPPATSPAIPHHWCRSDWKTHGTAQHTPRASSTTVVTVARPAAGGRITACELGGRLTQAASRPVLCGRRRALPGYGCIRWRRRRRPGWWRW